MIDASPMCCAFIVGKTQSWAFALRCTAEMDAEFVTFLLGGFIELKIAIAASCRYDRQFYYFCHLSIKKYKGFS